MSEVIKAIGSEALPVVESKVSAERVKWQKLSRFNPIRNLTPERLSRQIETFGAGLLREFSLTLDALERRDDVWQCVAAKRKGAAARREWEIKIISDLPEGKKREAQRHADALRYAYENLCTTNAVDENERGGVSLLVRQMMDAVGKKYAVHEVLWKVEGDRGQEAGDSGQARYSPVLRFVPLWFFENRTGRLQFLLTDFAIEGLPLEPGEWMVTVGQGIGEACAVAWLYKRFPLQAWVHYCEKHGTPGLHAKTEADRESTEWADLVKVLEDWRESLCLVTNSGVTLDKIETGASGELPFPGLVERMNRAIAALWRGADLSTMSAGEGKGQGASIQGEETKLMEADDAQHISETLNEYIDKAVIELTFGEGTTPLAYFRLSEDRDDEATAAFRRQVYLEFLKDGTVSDILANQSDLKDLTQTVGVPVNQEYVDPYIEVVGKNGGAETGTVRRDAEGDIVGGTTAAPVQGPAVPGMPMKDSAVAAANEAQGTGGRGQRPAVEADADNEELVAKSMAEALGVKRRWLAPLRPLIIQLLAALKDDSKDDAAVLQFIEGAANRLPELFGDMDVRALADVLEGALGTAVVNGLRDAIRGQRSEVRGQGTGGTSQGRGGTRPYQSQDAEVAG